MCHVVEIGEKDDRAAREVDSWVPLVGVSHRELAAPKECCKCETAGRCEHAMVKGVCVRDLV